MEPDAGRTRMPRLEPRTKIGALNASRIPVKLGPIDVREALVEELAPRRPLDVVNSALPSPEQL